MAEFDEDERIVAAISRYLTRQFIWSDEETLGVDPEEECAVEAHQILHFVREVDNDIVPMEELIDTYFPKRS